MVQHRSSELPRRLFFRGYALIKWLMAVNTDVVAFCCRHLCLSRMCAPVVLKQTEVRAQLSLARFHRNDSGRQRLQTSRVSYSAEGELGDRLDCVSTEQPQPDTRCFETSRLGDLTVTWCRWLRISHSVNSLFVGSLWKVLQWPRTRISRRRPHRRQISLLNIQWLLEVYSFQQWVDRKFQNFFHTCERWLVGLCCLLAIVLEMGQIVSFWKSVRVTWGLGWFLYPNDLHSVGVQKYVCVLTGWCMCLHPQSEFCASTMKWFLSFSGLKEKQQGET